MSKNGLMTGPPQKIYGFSERASSYKHLGVGGPLKIHRYFVLHGYEFRQKIVRLFQISQNHEFYSDYMNINYILLLVFTLTFRALITCIVKNTHG